MARTDDKRLEEVPHGDRLTLRFEGDDVPACAGESVAVALFASGNRVLSRSIKYHRPRGFFCLAGHCGACLMRIDGKPNVRACKTPVKEGMRVERQNAFPSGAFDVLGAADFFFPKGMDHHTMMTSPRALNAVHTPEGLLKVTAERYVYATGSYDQNAIFVDNDRPGVLPARAVGRLLVRFGVRPAERPVVVGDGPYARALAEALFRAGAVVTRV